METGDKQAKEKEAAGKKHDSQLLPKVRIWMHTYDSGDTGGRDALICSRMRTSPSIAIATNSLQLVCNERVDLAVGRE